MIATDVLSEAYTFPTDDLRQGHLGFLLSWLTMKGDHAARTTAAEEAERRSMSTNLDPEFEREELEPYVDEFNEARRDDNKTRMAKAERRIDRMLGEELTRRWDLTSQTLDVLESDKRRENRGVQKLVAASLDEVVPAGLAN